MEALSWLSRHASQHPAVQSPVHPRKSPTNLTRSPLPVGPRRKKTDRGQRSAFPSETSRFVPLIVAHKGSAPPRLVDDGSCHPPSPNLEHTHPIERYQAFRDSALFLSHVATSRRAPNWSSEEARTWKHHPQPTIPPPPCLNRSESQRQPVGCICRG